MSRDQQVVDLAVRTKLLTSAQIEDCRKLQSLLTQNGFQITMAEILAKKEFLSPDQIRLLNIAQHYEETRQTDMDLGAFLVRKGFLTQEKVNSCLVAQELPFSDGRPYPRLQDLLLQKNYVSPQQLHVILRAWQQIGQGTAPSVPPPAPAPKPIPPPARPAAAPGDRKPPPGPLELETLKVTVRKTRLKETPAGDRMLHVLELKGAIDGHTFARFDEFLNALIDSGATRVILDCEKLEYLSSAGVGVVAGALKRCRDGNGDLRLCTVGSSVRNSLNLVGLESMLRVYDSERGAIMSFKYT
jgi:anti-anti-sigma factor